MLYMRHPLMVSRYDPFVTTPMPVLIKWASRHGVRVKNETEKVRTQAAHPPLARHSATATRRAARTRRAGAAHTRTLHVPATTRPGQLALRPACSARLSQFSKNGSREYNVVASRSSILLVSFLIVPIGASTRGDSKSRQHHMMTVVNGHLLNNWSTSSIVRFDQTDLNDPMAALRQSDPDLKEKMLWVRAVFECTVM